jgi:hypothetical protein
MTSRKTYAILVGMSDTWPDEMTTRIAAEIKRLRGDRSGQWLSDRTAELGHRVSRSTISEIETGRRKSITVADLILLAWALRVPPIRLLYPKLPDGPVEVVPGRSEPSIRAATWFSGEEPFISYIGAKADAADPDEWDRKRQELNEITEGAQVVQLSRERITLESKIDTLVKLVARLRSSDDPSHADSFVSEVERAQDQLMAVNDRLRQVKGAVVSGDGG